MRRTVPQLLFYLTHAIFPDVMEIRASTDYEPSAAGGLQPSRIVVTTIAGTTWRVFVPTILGVGIGIWGDLRYHTKPWLTVGALVVGFAIAALLVWLQIKKIRK